MSAIGMYYETGSIIEGARRGVVDVLLSLAAGALISMVIGMEFGLLATVITTR